MCASSDGFAYTTNIRVHDFGAAIDEDDWIAGADLAAKTLVASRYTSPTPAEEIVFTSQAALLSSINRTGQTRFVVSSDRHEQGIEPTVNESIGWTLFGAKLVVDYVVYTQNPGNPTVTAPAGAPSWIEGSIHNITWTVASPEQSESAPCEYQIQFSKLGNFSDAVSVTTTADNGSYEWALPLTLVASTANTCKIRIRAKVTNFELYSSWVSSNAFTVVQNTAPTVTLVTPEDDGLLADTTPTFVFGTADTENNAIHAEFQVSYLADFSSLIIDTDSATDYADWTTSASPFTTWTAMDAGGATAGHRISYASPISFRYDDCYGRIRLKDAATAVWTTFSFTISVDANAPLQVTIDGTPYYVTSCVITENTGGEPSPIDVEITLDAFLAAPVEAGDEIAIASGLGGHNRSWNGTVESWTFAGDTVAISALQDDAYLSRKLCTGDEASADIGQNLADFVASYGAPLTGTNIDTATGLSAALTGGYKNLREHFSDALKVLPDYLFWVDSGGDVWFVDAADLTASDWALVEEDPS